MSILSICRSNPEVEMARAISTCFQKHYDESVLFLISGGSAFKVLDLIDIDSIGTNVTVSLLDERLDVSKDESNFFALSSTQFYKKALDKGVKFISLDAWPSIVGSKIVLATMGIGLDGHTAGIMPFPENPNKFQELFEDKNKMVVDYDAGHKNKYPHRLTATISFLKNHVDYAFVYAVGEEKKEILNTILNSPDSVPTYPALVIHKMKHAKLYTDCT